MNFLHSTRFWGLVGLAVVGFLQANFWIDQEIAQVIITILAGHIGIRTIDRLGEKAGATDTK